MIKQQRKIKLEKFRLEVAFDLGLKKVCKNSSGQVKVTP